MRTIVLLGLVCLAFSGHVPGLRHYYPQEFVPQHTHFSGQQAREPEFTQNLEEQFCLENFTGTFPNGTCHNLAFPLLGLANNIEIRFGEAVFEDGRESVNEDQVSAREVSNLVVDEPNGLPDNIKLTTRLLIFLGQFIDHDFALTLEQGEEEGGETLPIEVPNDDPEFDDDEYEFFRSVFVTVDNVREFTSINTPWLDLGNTYGDSQNLSDALRLFEGGRLNVTIIDGEEFPLQFPGTELFMCGDIRCEENPQLFAFHTLFLREHNRIADAYQAAEPDATDEEVFQFSRLLNIAQYQSIIWDFYLPYLLGRRTFAELTEEYEGHIEGTDPTLSVAFASAVYRYGHSGVPNDLLFTDSDGEPVGPGSVALAETFLEIDVALEPGNVQALFLGQGTIAHAPLDVFVADSIRNNLFANVPDNVNAESGFDLISRNIQRCRDHGCGNLNSYRYLFGLELFECENDPEQCFRDLTGEEEISAQLYELYDEIDNCDLFICGMAEKTYEDSLLGETFTVIMADQFRRLRDGDRIWYERIYEEEFSEEFLESVNIRFPARLADVVRNVFPGEETDEFTNAFLIDLAYVAWVDGSNIQIEWADPEIAREGDNEVEGYTVDITFPDGSQTSNEIEDLDELYFLLEGAEELSTYQFEVTVQIDGANDVTLPMVEVTTLAAVEQQQGDGLIAGLEPAVFGGIIGGVAGGLLLIGGGIFLIRRRNRFKNDDINAQFF